LSGFKPGQTYIVVDTNAALGEKSAIN
jgi:hypothetical protein